MASSDHRRHFADPLHLLLRARYGRDSTHVCDICRGRLAGLDGFRCGACDMDLHEACADYFAQTVTSFAHPWHALTLTRVPPPDAAGRWPWPCDLCAEPCPPGSFAYRCAACLFVAHPLCTMLPQTVRSPVHPGDGHDLRLVPSAGRCSACRGVLPVWHYVCHCHVRLHIACVSGARSAPGGGAAAAASRQQTASASGGGGHSASISSPVAKFLLKAIFRMAVHEATSGLASPVFDVLDAAFDSNSN